MFRENYSKWKDQALHECHDGSGSIIDKTPLEDLEIAEDGSVYIKGSLIHTEPGYVTSWDNSEFYCDWRN